jgi:Icc-related predicted phosphoesterase
VKNSNNTIIGIPTKKITHEPPYGILDKNMRGKHTGCEELKKKGRYIKT